LTIETRRDSQVFIYISANIEYHLQQQSVHRDTSLSVASNCLTAP